jgi:hypothetical protein
MDGWVAGKAGLRIAYSNQKLLFYNWCFSIEGISIEGAFHIFL